MIRKAEYKEACLDIRTTTPDEIISRSIDDEISSRMSAIIQSEAPIREALLFKRVINSLSLEKVGSRILPVFQDIASSIEYTKTEEDGECVYHYGDEDFFRPTPDSKVRYSYQIPYTEGANCILYIVENSEKETFSKSEMKKLFLEQLEYQKCGSQVEKLFANSLKDERIQITRNGRIKKL